MKRKWLIGFLISLFFSSILLSQKSSAGTLEITFTGIRKAEGVIVAGFNSTPKGWPRKSDKEYLWDKEKLQDGILVVEISGLAHGTYAISVLDDENSNHELDLLRGERFGFSMNPRVKFSAPKFEDCSFLVHGDLTKIEIRLKDKGK